jgi:Haem-binding domain
MSSHPGRSVWLRRIVLGLVALLALAQVVRPERSNPTVEIERTLERVSPPPAALQATLRRACYDCHSNETSWPWYSQIAPISWALSGHVVDARRHLNFSDWTRMTTGKKRKVVGEICDEVKEGAMPLPSYLWIHRDAHLMPQEVRVICEWTAAEERRIADPSTRP